ncbi:leucine-rich repeat, immunoglobulin-like domain and transmembrane domain-containing protein 3 isoform X2 [Strigops habroptila]|uniref:leucine-rich repeat, immunoglobulin-like domain and transmembrane domain-containing protein 3 isoform X2 n=1 Tax=Strigops habroptila TaxID=2489341 RepID=UPI0011CEF56B|nr:leucine-rich repeat, immunoglobulin-like domain and transmembrane domain-containing protein 3 isoform X2 [Strigops habroptila]
MYLFVYFYLLMSFFEELHGFCPSQCTCVYHGRSDGTGARSVLCNDPDMYEIPVNVPVDTVKLRIEKTVIRRIPTEAFYYLVDLKYLWVTYNCVANIDISSFYNLKQLHELRLDGNLLSTFPWESLAEMPNLRTLDLHNNKVTSIPADAGRYLKNLTYLDISSNKLTTLPSDLMDIWPPFSEAVLSKSTVSLATQRVILGLQDNPWFCDCRISKLIEFSKIVDNSVVLLDPMVSCSGPESLAGILFQRAELEQCLKPSVMTSATKITSPLGSNVLLRCDATGYPTPQLTWTRSDNIPVNYTVIQETPGEGVRWSIMSLTGISYRDAGEYRCKAKNLAGMAEAAVTVTVVGVVTTTGSPQKYGRKQEAQRQNTTQDESKQEPERTTTPLPITPTTTALVSTETSTSIRFTVKKQSRPMSDGRKNSKAVTNGIKKQTGDTSRKGEGASLNAASMAEQNVTVKNLRVISETDERVTLTWKTVNATSSSAVTVLYSKYGEKDMLPLSTDSSKNKVTIDGLQPRTQYMACVSPKGVPPTKEQCIIFSTDGLNDESTSQFSILILASSAACVVVLPLIFFLIYKVLKLHMKPKTVKEADLSKESYVKFETLSLKPRTVCAGEQLWARRYTDESERLLLCSRSSMDSQMTFKSEGSRSEYLC